VTISNNATYIIHKSPCAEVYPSFH